MAKTETEPQDQHYNSEAIAIGLLVFAITIIAIVFLPEDHALAKWFYRWQALLAGLFAVIAAYLTVREMRMSRLKQQIAHRQLVALSIRKEAISATRNLSNVIGYYQIQKGFLQIAAHDTDNLLSSYLSTPSMDSLGSEMNADSLLKLLTTTAEYRNQKHFPPIEEIIDDIIERHFSFITQSANYQIDLIRKAQTGFTVQGDGMIKEFDELSWLQDSDTPFEDGVGNVIHNIENLLVRLKDLREFYRRTSPLTF